MTKAEAEEIFIHCSSIVDVLGGDVRAMCKRKGMPEEYIDHFIKEADNSSYDKFIKAHHLDGSLSISEPDAVKKLNHLGIKAGITKSKKKVIIVPKDRDYFTTVETNLCQHLSKKYGYSYVKTK